MIKSRSSCTCYAARPRTCTSRGTRFPYPWRALCDKEDLIRLGDHQALHVAPQQNEHRIRSLERCIHYRDKGSIAFSNSRCSHKIYATRSSAQTDHLSIASSRLSRHFVETALLSAWLKRHASSCLRRTCPPRPGVVSLARAVLPRKIYDD